LQVGGGAYEKEEKMDKFYPTGSQEVVLECSFFKKKVFFLFLETLSEDILFKERFLKVQRSCFAKTFVDHLVDKEVPLCFSKNPNQKKMK
jgi:hypothetical protein